MPGSPPTRKPRCAGWSIRPGDARVLGRRCSTPSAALQRTSAATRSSSSARTPGRSPWPGCERLGAVLELGGEPHDPSPDRLARRRRRPRRRSRSARRPTQTTTSWRRSSTRNSPNSPEERRLVGIDGGVVVGTLRLTGTTARTMIYGFVIDARRRGERLGTRMLAPVLAQLREEGVTEVGLEVLPGQHPGDAPLRTLRVQDRHHVPVPAASSHATSTPGSISGSGAPCRSSVTRGLKTSCAIRVGTSAVSTTTVTRIEYCERLIYPLV